MSEDKYAAIRAIPLRDVLAMCGYTKWKSRKGGREFYGACPFHKPKHNKTSFSFDDRRFNCFSCSESGSGAIDLLMKLRKIGFQESVEFLRGAASQHHSVSNNGQEQETIEISTPSENKPFAGSYEKFYVKSDWLKARGLTEETLKFFGVGQYNNPARRSTYSGKVMCPIFRFKDGIKVGYTVRSIEENPEFKWLFPKGFAKSLEVFAAWHVKLDAQKKGLTLPLKMGFLVESPLCAMKYFQMGLPAVSCFGAFVSKAQLEIIQHLFRGVVYLPDRDKYGQVAPVIHLLSQRLWVKAPELPVGTDDPEKLEQPEIVRLLKSVVR